MCPDEAYPKRDVSLPAGRFPVVRMRRLRYQKSFREFLRETVVEPRHLIYPLFVRFGEKERRPIGAMPGCDQISVDLLGEELRRIEKEGIGGVILFGIPESKDAEGSDALSEQGIIARAVREAKDAVDDLLIMTDLCFCEYTDHGHCGPLVTRGDTTDVDNDATLALLARQALVHARAGADVIAPSGMMDGMIATIRTTLDREGFSHLPIVSYAAKYASAFYGPFREAAESAPQFGDRRTYQMDPAAAAEQAVREVELDLAEGADVIMVKPALPYLDILRLLHDRFPGIPLAAYHVSGEYSMVQAAAEKGWIDARAVATESLLSLRRAGASMILTYWAREFARWSNG